MPNYNKVKSALNRGWLYLLLADMCVSIYPLYCEGECLMKGNALGETSATKSLTSVLGLQASFLLMQQCRS